MRYLKQNTDQYVPIGPFVLAADGLTTKDDVSAGNITYLLATSTHAAAGVANHYTGACSTTAADDYG